MNFKPSLSLCTSQTLHVVHELKKDDHDCIYMYKDPQNKCEQFIELLECPTCISATCLVPRPFLPRRKGPEDKANLPLAVFTESRYDYQLLLP